MNSRRVAIYDAATDGFGSKAKIAVVAAWFWPENEWRLYPSYGIPALVGRLNCCGLLIGHNVTSFDNPIIERVGRSKIIQPVFDLAAECKLATGHTGWALDAIGKAMGLGGKLMTGAAEAELVKQNKLIEVADAAMADVRLILRILQAARASGGLVKGMNATARIPVWPLSALPCGEFQGPMNLNSEVNGVTDHASPIPSA